MTQIRRVGAGTPHIHGEATAGKKHAIDRNHDAVVDKIEKRRPGSRLDPHEMRRHIDKVLDGPWGPVDARALYAAPIGDPPGVPGNGRPGWPGDARSLYAVDINPDPIRPRPPEFQPMYGVDINPTPRWPPIDFQPLYSIGSDPPSIREPPIRAMYGIDLGDGNLWPRKA